MIQFINLDIEGFSSIGNNFRMSLTHNTIVIQGRNGSGKTTLFSAYVWALYGKNLKGVSEVGTWEIFRNKDYKGTKVVLDFKDDSHSYQIIRCQNYKATLPDGAKGNNRLIFTCDKKPYDIKSKYDLQAQINKVVGMNYNLFMNSIVFGQGMKRFIQETNADKKKIFEQLLSMTFLDKAKDLAKQEIDKIEAETIVLFTEITRIRDRIQHLKSVNKDLKVQETKEKTKNQETLAMLRVERKGKTKDLLALNNKYSEQFREITPVRLKWAEDRIEQANCRLEKANKILNNLSLEELLDTLECHIRNKAYASALNKIKALKKYFKEISELEGVLKVVRKRYIKLKEITHQIEKVDLERIHLANEIVHIDSKIKTLESPQKDPIRKNYTKDIQKYREELKPKKAQYEKYQDKLKAYQWLLKDPLSTGGIKAFLIDSYISQVNSILKSYQNTLGFRIEFMVDMDSVNKDLLTYIYKGKDLILYQELSGGEKQLVNLAVAFALNEILTLSKGFNIAFLDEVFESLSQDNIEISISLMEQVFKNKTLFLITHHESLPIHNAKTLRVEKAEGLSLYTIL